MSYKQSGFAIIEIVILAVVVVGILGFIGWSYFNHQPTKKAASATTNSTSPSKETTTSATVTPQSTYLDFKEFGVKVTLDSTITDAEYAVKPVASDGTHSIGITAQSLLNKDPKCGPETLGLVIETSTQPTLVGGQQTIPVDNKSLFKFGNTYYWYVRPQNQGCLTTTQADGDLISGKIQAFQQAFTTLQPDN